MTLVIQPNGLLTELHSPGPRWTGGSSYEGHQTAGAYLCSAEERWTRQKIAWAQQSRGAEAARLRAVIAAVRAWARAQVDDDLAPETTRYAAVMDYVRSVWAGLVGYVQGRASFDPTSTDDYWLALHGATIQIVERQASLQASIRQKEAAHAEQQSATS